MGSLELLQHLWKRFQKKRNRKMDYLLILVFVFQTWIIIGIVFLIFELFDGSTIFFLPLSLSSFFTSLYVFALESFFLPPWLFVDKWYEILLFWALLGLVISFVLVKFWKRSSTEDKDINNY